MSMYVDSAHKMIRQGWVCVCIFFFCTQPVAIRVGRHWLQRRIDSDRPSPFLKKQRSVCVCQRTSSVCWFQQQPDGGHLFSWKEDVLLEAIHAPPYDTFACGWPFLPQNDKCCSVVMFDHRACEHLRGGGKAASLLSSSILIWWWVKSCVDECAGLTNFSQFGNL